jgi:predicted PurR-regulated permease PerM
MNLQKTFFLALLSRVSLAFIWLVSPFLMPVFWAATLAIVFNPVQRRVAIWLRGHATPGALVTLTLILLTVIVPSMLLISAVANEASALYQQIQDGELDPTEALDWVQSNLPVVSRYLTDIGVDLDDVRQNVSSFAVKGSRYVGSMALTVGQNALNFTVQFFLMLYLLFFFLRDGKSIIEALIVALPLGDARERALFAKFAEVSRATVKGTMMIGAIQGTIGGLMFAFVGIEAAVFWGVMMMVLSLLPVVGASLVWAPAALVLFIQGEVGNAMFLLLFGAVAIGLIDNLLRPLLVGRDTRMPDYLVLFSTLGGLSMFGISGFVIGPIIAALFLSMWVMFTEENGPE